MEDVKDKMKGLFKKSNKPFKGQSHILGSSSSSSSSSTSNSSSSRLIPPLPPPTTIISKSDSRAANCIKIFLSGRPAESSVEIMIKLLKNVLQEPGNDKFRKIRMGNPRIKAAVGDVAGGVEVLECAGFRVEEEEGERWARMAGELTRERMEGIRDLILGLERWKGEKDENVGGDGVGDLDGRDGEKMMIDRKVLKGKDDKAVGNGVVENFDGGEEDKLIDRKVWKGKDDKVVGNGVVENFYGGEEKMIDRKVRVFFSVPESVAAKIDLPDSFYNVSVEELRREADARKKKIADSQLLIPRSYKEKQAMAARKKYKLTVIRIQFPDGVVLQGVFSPSEQTTALYKFVSSALKDPTLEFELISPVMARVHVIPRFRGADGRTPTLEEENLVPSVLIKFKPIETDSIVFIGLANEFLELMEPLTASTTVL